MEKKLYDLVMGFNGRNNIHAWNRGFFEKSYLTFTDECIEIGVFRIIKSEYERNKEAFDKWIDRNGKYYE